MSWTLALAMTAAMERADATHPAVASLYRWLASHAYVLWTVGAYAVLLSLICWLFIWVGTRQFMPRKAPRAPPSVAISPKHRQLRHTKSFSDVDQLERELRDAEATGDDSTALPIALRLKCTPDQCKLIIDTLSKVLAFLRSEYIEALTRELRMLPFQPNEEIFATGKHDGSILVVASGEASLTIHAEDGQRFTKRLERGQILTSSLSLLAALVDEACSEESIELQEKVMGKLSAKAEVRNTVVLEIPVAAVRTMVKDHPDSFVRLAQSAFSQTEKITAKSLVDHFGLAEQILTPLPVVSPMVLDDTDGFQPNAPADQLARVIAAALGAAADAEEVTSLAEAARIIRCEKSVVVDEHATSSSILVVVQGSAQVQIPLNKKTTTTMHEVARGCMIGIASCFVGNPPPRRILCPAGTVLLSLPLASFSPLLRNHAVAVKCARHIVRQYSSLVCSTDSSFEWIHLHSGESLLDFADRCDAVYTVISGRLRAIQGMDNSVNIASELGRGATLGALDMLAAGRSNASVFAIRDSQISQMPRSVFDYVVSKQPKVLIHFTSHLARRLHAANVDSSSRPTTSRSSSCMLSLGDATPSPRSTPPQHTLPIGTIAVVSITQRPKLHAFCACFQTALQQVGMTEVVSSKRAISELGPHCLKASGMERANLSAWTAEIETVSDLVLYEADESLTSWSNLCIRQADHILLLCDETAPPQGFLREMVSILEQVWARKNVAISVVRLRDENWTLSALEVAAQVQADQSKASERLRRHIRLWKSDPMMPKFLLSFDKYEWIRDFHNVQTPFSEHHADFERLSRRVTGRSIGLVLGGGGARGLAHIGVLQALEECGVNVDVVGGTSMGAFVGGVYALYPHRLDMVRDKVRIVSNGLSSVVEKLLELTLPIVSFFNGTRFNRCLRDQFFDLGIEDMMLSFFCVSTDIAKSRMGIHRSGAAWKYIRASMSLSGYLPPIAEDGSLYLDGGYMNNLPADVMRGEGGIQYVVAVDVGSEARRDYFNYGSALSGWWLLWNKLNPFAKTVAVPSMGDVSGALAYVSSEQHKDRVRDECIDLYLRPPVNDYGTLQFDKMDEIVRVGYEYALPRIKGWIEHIQANDPQSPTSHSSRVSDAEQTVVSTKN